MTFPALSIQQPWAWLILRPDLVGDEVRAAARRAGLFKDIENRTWGAAVRGWVLVHASDSRVANWDYSGRAVFAAKRGVDVPHRHSLPYGAIVGAMRFDDCVERSASRWFHVDPPKAGEERKPHRGFVIGASVAFAEPVKCAGQVKLFRVPAGGVDGDPSEFGRICTAIRAAGLAASFGVREESQ